MSALFSFTGLSQAFGELFSAADRVTSSLQARPRIEGLSEHLLKDIGYYNIGLEYELQPTNEITEVEQSQERDVANAGLATKATARSRASP